MSASTSPSSLGATLDRSAGDGPDVNDGSTPTVMPATDEFVGAELDRHRSELMEVMQHANVRLEIDPIVHVQTRGLIGAEALARFPGQMNTADWFQLAHAIGVGGRLELSVLDAAIEHSRTMTSGFLGVNLSPAVLVDPACVERLRDTDDDRLVVEITDQTSVPELGLLHMHIDEIRDAGVRIATHVSEFAGALRALQRLAPDMVKLSPALTARLAAGQADPSSVEFLAHCRYEGAFVVAVGVERADQLDVLSQNTVDAVQGRFVTEHLVAG